MRFLKANGLYGHYVVLAHEQPTGRAYAYVPKLRTWHRDQTLEAALDPGTGPTPTLAWPMDEIGPAEAAMLLRGMRTTDRRRATDRAAEDLHRAQVRQSGDVLTSSEVGLLSKTTRHKMSCLPMLKDLLEVRSAHKRWTRLYLYEQHGSNSTRRSAIADLRGNAELAHSSKGWPLEVRHRLRTLEIGDTVRTYVAVECKYLRPEPGQPTTDGLAPPEGREAHTGNDAPGPDPEEGWT